MHCVFFFNAVCSRMTNSISDLITIMTSFWDIMMLIITFRMFRLPKIQCYKSFHIHDAGSHIYLCIQNKLIYDHISFTQNHCFWYQSRLQKQPEKIIKAKNVREDKKVLSNHTRFLFVNTSFTQPNICKCWLVVISFYYISCPI